jgi:serine O-acetyltransferase
MVPYMNENDLLDALRGDARRIWEREAVLRRKIDALFLRPESLAAVTVKVLGSRISDQHVEAESLEAMMLDILEGIPSLSAGIACDVEAVLTRDPASRSLISIFLNQKGFLALQLYRVGHALWREGRRDIAYYLQGRASVVMDVDIHPACNIGKGIMLDHGSGIVIGETCSIDDDVSIMHSVTLGGTGKHTGDRHPKIRSGVAIGAGAVILGPIVVGESANVAAGSVVLRDVPPFTTVAGVPATVVGESGAHSPARSMKKTLSGEEVYAFPEMVRSAGSTHAYDASALTNSFEDKPQCPRD